MGKTVLTSLMTKQNGVKLTREGVAITYTVFLSSLIYGDGRREVLNSPSIYHDPKVNIHSLFSK